MPIRQLLASSPPTDLQSELIDKQVHIFTKSRKAKSRTHGASMSVQGTKAVMTPNVVSVVKKSEEPKIRIVATVQDYNACQVPESNIFIRSKSITPASRVVGQEYADVTPGTSPQFHSREAQNSYIRTGSSRLSASKLSRKEVIIENYPAAMSHHEMAATALMSPSIDQSQSPIKRPVLEQPTAVCAKCNKPA